MTRPRTERELAERVLRALEARRSGELPPIVAGDCPGTIDGQHSVERSSRRGVGYFGRVRGTPPSGHVWRLKNDFYRCSVCRQESQVYASQLSKPGTV